MDTSVLTNEELFQMLADRGVSPVEVEAWLRAFYLENGYPAKFKSSGREG